MEDKVNITPQLLAARWSRAGALFNAPPAADSPDLEALLLDTARHAHGNSRLYTMAASWLASNDMLILPERLRALIRDELEPRFQPAMGLILDTARGCSGSHRLDAAISACSPAATPEPFFDAERTNPVLRKLAERHASPLSRKWNLWAGEFKLKSDAIKTLASILLDNPIYQDRLSEAGTLALPNAHDLRPARQAARAS